MRADAAAVILAMAGLTWGLRWAGLLLARRLLRHAALARALRQMPGCVMAALVAPAVLQGGPAQWLGAAATALVMARLHNLPAAMAAGIAAVAAARQWPL
jgi:uncharacterized membrane protein